jgi:hypothetical protein
VEALIDFSRLEYVFVIEKKNIEEGSLEGEYSGLPSGEGDG